MKSTLIIGGARSGKSRFAQELALKSDSAVLFVATAEAGDEEMRQRIEEHRKVRPSIYLLLYVHWRPPMPKKKQKLTEKPTEEAIKKLFPKKVVDKLKEVAHEKDSK